MNREEIEDFLLKKNLEEEDLEFMWEFCNNFNVWTVQNISKNGEDWKALKNMAALESLIQVYERLRDRILDEDAGE